MVVVSSEVLPVYEQVVVLVELPELAVDDVEVLVAEEVGHLKEFHESSSLRIEGIHSRNGIFGWKRKLYRFFPGLTFLRKSTTNHSKLGVQFFKTL